MIYIPLANQITHHIPRLIYRSYDFLIIEKCQRYLENIAQYVSSYIHTWTHSSMRSHKQRITHYPNKKIFGDRNHKTAADDILNTEKIDLLGNQHFINRLHRAIDEGNMEDICDHIDWVRGKMGLASLSDSERVEVEIFYKEYLRQHPPDGLLRMAQFVNAALEHFS